MHPHPGWRSVIALTCSFAVIVAALVWTRRRKNADEGSSGEGEKRAEPSEGQVADSKREKRNGIDMSEQRNCVKPQPNDRVISNHVANPPRVASKVQRPSDTISELPNPNWVRVGQVQELYIYPLKSGRGKDIRECFFSEYGITVRSKGRVDLRDRMFLVYSKETGRFQTGRNYPTMILVTLSAVDEFKVRLEAVGMPSVVFSLPEDSQEQRREAVECKMWWGEPIKCIDCGPEPAEWLSRFLTGTSSGLRLGYTCMEKRNPDTGPWEKFCKTYDKLSVDDGGLFSDVTSYMLMNSTSLKKLNEKLERPVPALQFRPNIVICGPDAFAEDAWEWIKIGERAVIRNVKPCPRCKMIKIDPETGSMHEEEPFKSLESFREQTDPDRLAVDGKSPTMGIYCGLYVTGNVKQGDDVFVHVPEDSSQPT